MTNQEIFEKAISKLDYPLHKIEISWSTDDLLSRAIDMEGENWESIYDIAKFTEALENIKSKHDANLGITWDTIDFALNYYCRKGSKDG